MLPLMTVINTDNDTLPKLIDDFMFVLDVQIEAF